MAQQAREQSGASSAAAAAPCLLDEARAVLDDIARWATPADQLRVLQRTSAAIAVGASRALNAAAAPGAAPTPIGADALFPLFVHVGTQIALRFVSFCVLLTRVDAQWRTRDATRSRRRCATPTPLPTTPNG